MLFAFIDELIDFPMFAFSNQSPFECKRISANLVRIQCALEPSMADLDFKRVSVVPYKALRELR